MYCIHWHHLTLQGQSLISSILSLIYCKGAELGNTYWKSYTMYGESICTITFDLESESKGHLECE